MAQRCASRARSVPRLRLPDERGIFPRWSFGEVRWHDTPCPRTGERLEAKLLWHMDLTGWLVWSLLERADAILGHPRGLWSDVLDKWAKGLWANELGGNGALADLRGRACKVLQSVTLQSGTLRHTFLSRWSVFSRLVSDQCVRLMQGACQRGSIRVGGPGVLAAAGWHDTCRHRACWCMGRARPGPQ